MMTFKHFFLQSFKATKAPPPTSKRFISAKLRNKIWDRLAKSKVSRVTLTGRIGHRKTHMIDPLLAPKG
jgi:hypothetical protein